MKYQNLKLAKSTCKSCGNTKENTIVTNTCLECLFNN